METTVNGLLAALEALRNFGCGGSPVVVRTGRTLAPLSRTVSGAAGSSGRRAVELETVPERPEGGKA